MKNLLTESLFIKGGTFESLDEFTPVELIIENSLSGKPTEAMYFRVCDNVVQIVLVRGGKLVGMCSKAIKEDLQYSYDVQKTQIKSRDLAGFIKSDNPCKRLLAIGCRTTYFNN